MENQKISRKKKLMAIIVILVIISTSFIYTYANRQEHSFQYKVSVNIDGTTPYKIIVPFLNFTEKVDYWQNLILTTLTNYSSASLDIVTTAYGIGLQISSNRTMTFEINLNKNVPVNSITMEEVNETFGIDTLPNGYQITTVQYRYDYWIYGNYSQATTSKFYVDVTMRTTNEDYSFFRRGVDGLDNAVQSWDTTSPLLNGWNKYVGDRQLRVG
jgi:hypothetical protein